MTKAKDQRSQSMKEQAYNVDRDKDHKSSTTKAISLISRRSVTMNSLRGRFEGDIGLPTETLGYLCEEVSLDVVEQDRVNKILTVVVQGMNPTHCSNDVKLVAMWALYNALSFTQAISIMIWSETTL
ncbi:importin subunit beta-1-like protein [Tanacetum coccineum]|uniref:Importin subunit beta-1-like protein n=1 Tax=Tanacetum coccineum TaxID=301880 RepID=A0ABQ4Y3J5_9ASTR